MRRQSFLSSALDKDYSDNWAVLLSIYNFHRKKTPTDSLWFYITALEGHSEIMIPFYSKGRHCNTY